MTVVCFCKNCHACQVVAKPNQVVTPARLHPFLSNMSLQIVFCALPETKPGNQFLLTIMWVAMRFPEAVSL